MKRSGSRGKFLMCFRPVVEMEDCILDDGFGLHQSKSAALLSIERTKSHACLISSDELSGKGILDRSASDCSAFTGGRRSVSSEEEVVAPTFHRRRKSFSRAIKAALIEPMLSKRANNRKSTNRVADESNRGSSLTRMGSIDDEQYNSIRKEFDETKSSSTSSSSPSSSSRASSGSLPSLSSGSDSEIPPKSSSVAKRAETRKPEQGPEADPKQSGSLTACLLLLITLAVTVLGGKFLGVALTLICLYSHPRRRQKQSVADPPAGEARKASEENRASREYRKQRVVMEGMLKRNHRSNHYLKGHQQKQQLQQSK